MMTKNSFSTWPNYSEEEAAAISKVLLSNKVNYWTGEECRLFETEFAEWVGANYTISLANGTVALELALRALGIEEGDEVIVTPRSFVASASCVVNVGGIPVFSDVDPASGNMTANNIKGAITEKTKAIIVVHLAGWPCDMDPINELAKAHSLAVVEDCAQAHGAKYKGKSVGTIGDIGVWSFCQDKIITTGGEGGMVTTQNQHYWEKMWSYKDHGKAYKAVFDTQKQEGFRWLHESFGSNFRMTELQAAIGRIQLRKMPEWGRKRTENARKLKKQILSWVGASSYFSIPNLHCLSGCGLNNSEQCKFDCAHANYKFYVYVNERKLPEGWTRDRIKRYINEAGVPCMQGACPEIYLEKAFVEAGIKPRREMHNSKALGDRSLMFLIHPSLTDDEITKTVEVMRDVVDLIRRDS